MPHDHKSPQTTHIRAAAHHPSSSGIAKPAVVQRAIAVNNSPLPRTHETPANIVSFLKSTGVYDQFVVLNDDRDIIYIFGSDQHFLDHLKTMAGIPIPSPVPPPLKHTLTSDQLQKGHEFAQDVRFTSIFQPGSSQISERAPGAHKIPENMIPPPGAGHHWAKMQAPTTVGMEYVNFENRLVPPVPTVPLTFGNPAAPSLVMHQGGLNLGMHIQPAPAPFLDPIKRSDTRYAGLPSVPGRVRGHPFELAQNQVGTDTPGRTFDNDPRTYTDESDSTKTNGGISSWRFNEVEKLATKSGRPFTQVNNNPVLGPMGIARPDTIDFRIDQGGGARKDLHMDNTATTDYRGTDGVRPKKMGKQAYQSEMGRQEAIVHPYVPPPVHKQGQDFTDPSRHTYPGYMSPPPSPFLSEDTLSSTPEIIILAGFPSNGSRVNMSGGRTGIVVEVIDRDRIKRKSRCKVREIPVTGWPGSFGTI